MYRSNPITWPVDIRSAVNRGFCAAPRPPGLAEAVGTSPDLQGIQPGRIRVFDLEFSLLDPSANKGKSIFALRKGDAAFAESAAVAFGRECDWIYILNSGLWMDRHGVVGHVWIVYADQTRERIDITEGVHMAYIWRGPGLASAVRVRLAGVGPEGGDGFFYATALKNPHPDRRIHELVFSAAEGAPQKPIWFVLAVCAGQGSNAIGAETAAYTVDTATVAGPVRRLNGVNLGNGGNISGATSATLSLASAQGVDAGDYTVVIANGIGPVNRIENLPHLGHRRHVVVMNGQPFASHTPPSL